MITLQHRSVSLKIVKNITIKKPNQDILLTLWWQLVTIFAETMWVATISW
jgi:hypothetical protein